MLVHFLSDAGKKRKAPGTWQLGSWKLLRFYFLASWLKKVSERCVCCQGRGGGLLHLQIFILS